jgi:metallo-beta-lactamase family protein
MGRRHDLVPPTPDRGTRPERPVLTFLGGAGTVTGSRFLVDTPRSSVLVDCGLFQGLKELRLRNWEDFPVDPAGIDAVVVTHAHVDHIGYLPRLRNLGFRGPVFCTPGTAELAAIVLPDSGHLQEEEAAFANRMGYSKHRPALPLYTEHDARETLRLLRPTRFDERTPITDDIAATLRPAGHILGSATLSLEFGDAGPTVLFSGDLGRPGHPVLVPPRPPDDADVVVMESTYGGRHHDDAGALERLADAIVRTAARGGTVLIPAFAVDRTEVVLFHLREMMAAGTIPRLPVYADSPMALRAMQVYRDAIDRGDPDVRADLHGGPDPFDTGTLVEVRDVEDSKALADAPHPAIIISASGMATGGRVLHHLARLLPDHRNTVVLVGYQAEGTRGRRLADGDRELKLLGRYVRVRAEIAHVGSFSVHADHGELIAWLSTMATPPEAVYLVHGEPDAAATLADAIEDDLDLPAIVAQDLERIRLR